MILQENVNNTNMEKSLARIPNRFELTLCATYRARQLSQGHSPKIFDVHKNHKKSTTLALLEVAEGLAGIELLKKAPL